jgi:MerR HTH family regulatory protein
VASSVDTTSEQVFTSSDVSRIAKVSLRQLQWWDERKLISPHQEGHRRVYLREGVIEIMVVAELRRRGLALQKDPAGFTIAATGASCANKQAPE